MRKGAKVICVNDVFPPTIIALYKQLPKKDEVYTVREVTLGRDKILEVKDGKPVMNGASDKSCTVRILLEELRNDIDIFHHHGQEMGFNAERFRELEEKSNTEFSEEHLFAGETIKDGQVVTV